MTLPVLLAYQGGDTTEREFWRRTIEATEQNEADLDRALHIMRHRGAIDAPLERARGFAAAAKAALGSFPETTLRRALLDVTDYTVSRAR